MTKNTGTINKTVDSFCTSASWENDVVSKPGMQQHQLVFVFSDEIDQIDHFLLPERDHIVALAKPTCGSLEQNIRHIDLAPEMVEFNIFCRDSLSR